MTEAQKLMQATGLRWYPDAPEGVEVHHAGQTVYTAKNRPQALAFMAGVAWAQTVAAAGRTSATTNDDGG